jgi:hypothetical protein
MGLPLYSGSRITNVSEVTSDAARVVGIPSAHTDVNSSRQAGVVYSSTDTVADTREHVVVPNAFP